MGLLHPDRTSDAELVLVVTYMMKEELTEYEVVVRMCRSSGMAMTGGSAVTPRAMTSATVSWLVMLLMLELVMGSERKGTQDSCR